MEKKSRRRPGRPRNENLEEAVLAAAYKVVMKEGLGRLTIERIAADTGVGKATIYRRWSNAHELAMAAFMAHPDAEFRSTRGTPKHQLTAHLRSVVARFSAKRGRQITLTMAASEGESELSKAFRNQVILKSRQTGEELIRLGVKGGSIAANVDMETVLDMLYGPIFYRLLAGHRPLDGAFAESIVAALFEGVGVKPD